MMNMRRSLLVVLLAAVPLAAQQKPSALNLPSSKLIVQPAPGDAQRTNSMPVALAVSPDGRWVVSVNTGYGTIESRYMQSLSVMETATGKLRDYPDDRTQQGRAQVFSGGIAFSGDGQRLYVTLGSTTFPEGGHDKNGDDATGNGIAVFSFNNGKPHADSFLPIPLQQLAAGRTTLEINKDKGGDKGVPYPSAVAVVNSSSAPERLLVADNLSDDAILMGADGRILTRFDLSESNTVPGTYPVAVAVSADGSRGYVALWNASEVVSLDLTAGTVVDKLPLLRPASPVAPGSHPVALTLSPDGRTLFVALSNRDTIAAIDVSHEMHIAGYFDTRLPRQTYFGSQPQSIAVSPDGSRLYAADGGSNNVAVCDLAKLASDGLKHGFIRPLGFIPTEWMPTSVALANGHLLIATGKGTGTGPNNFAQPHVPDTFGQQPHDVTRLYRSFTYAPTLVYGSIARIDAAHIDANLAQWTSLALSAARQSAAGETISFARGSNPIRHIIYIIKENRTYDQIYGDLRQNNQPVGNGDPTLTMYGESTTPNLHKLALQFGVFDNFFDSGEISGQGHVWSNAAIDTDYLDRTIWANYRSGQRTYDYEGMVANGYPLLQQIPDIEEPTGSYLWTNLAAHGKSYYHFAEYISTTFCSAHAGASAANVNPTQGPVNTANAVCERPAIHTGEQIPDIYGGGVSKYTWDIPLIASNTPTKPELVGHFAKESPDFNLKVPDQFRVEVFLHYLTRWQSDLASGHDTMPQFIQLRMPNDHTAGTSAGSPTPKASVADNDLAVGRAVEAISNSAFWDSTAIFVIEDDAQNGADHVDAHRSTALVISKYSPHAGRPFVDSRFYTTVSMIRTMETLLGLPPMNNNDAFAPLMAPVFTGDGSQPAFTADYRNRDNGLIYTANDKYSRGARASSKMDFTHADRADARKLNQILWRDAMGNAPMPAMIRVKLPKQKDDDD